MHISISKQAIFGSLIAIVGALAVASPASADSSNCQSVSNMLRVQSASFCVQIYSDSHGTKWVRGTVTGLDQTPYQADLSGTIVVQRCSGTGSGCVAIASASDSERSYGGNPQLKAVTAPRQWSAGHTYRAYGTFNDDNESTNPSYSWNSGRVYTNFVYK